MANRVKGITIEIDGNVTGLDKALKGVNSNIRSTSQALKDVERLLKIDPKNTELLAQKQKLLSEAVGQTKDKLTQLQAAEKKAKEALENGDLGQDKYDALQREIIETENELKKLEDQQKSTETAINGSTQTMSDKMKAAGGAFKDAGTKLNDVSDKMKDAGKTMTTHVTAPIAAGAAGAVAAFKEIDNASDILIQKTGAQGKAFEDMKAIMEDIATTIPVDFETAANAVGEVNTRFGVTGDQLQDLSTRFVEFSELNNTDVPTSIDNTQKALSAFGLGAESAGMLLDVLNRTGQNTGVSMDALTAGLIQNGAAFQEMGLSIDQATVFMGQMETSGANSETVMQGLRKALKNAAEDGVPLNQALQDLQGTIENGKGGVDGLTAAYELFGKSGDQIYAAVKNGTLDFTQLASSQSILKDSTDSVSKAYKDTVDPMEQAKMAMNDAKLIGADIATTAMPMIKDALEGLRDLLKDLKNWWDGLSQGQQESILKFTMIAAVVGPILGILGSLIGIISGVSTVIGVLTTAIGALEATALPIIAIIAAIIAAIAAIVLVIKNWGKITEWLGGLWEGFKDTVGKIWNGIASVVGGIVDGIKNTVGKAWEGIKSVTGTVFGAVKDFIGGAFNKAKDFVGGAVSKIKDGVSGAWDKVKSKTSEVFGNVKNFIVDNFNKSKEAQEKAVSKIKDGVVSAWNSIKSKTSEVFGSVKNAIVDNFNKSKQAQENILGKMKDGIGSAWNTIKSKTSSAFGSIKEAITNHMSNAAKNNAKFGNAISNKLSGAWDAIKSKTGSTFSNIKDTMGDLMGGARDKVKGAIDKIRGFFNFKWSLPKIKLPHFKKHGKFSLNPPQVPSFSVDWYDKAMKTGRILKGATIFGMMNGKLLGGGESGSETVVGTKSLMGMIHDAVTSAMNAIRSMSGNSSYATALQPAGVTVSYGDINMTIHGAPGQDVKELADIVSDRIRTAYDREAKTWA